MSNLTVFNQTLTAAKTQDYLAQVLGDKKQSFVNNLTALVANNATLQECEPITLMYAGIKATALDLPLDANLGFAYVIPFRDNKQNKTLAQFQIGYRGFLQLAQRSGLFKTINVRDVRDGEIVAEDFISGEIQFQKLKENRETAKIIGYVAYFKLNNSSFRCTKIKTLCPDLALNRLHISAKQTVLPPPVASCATIFLFLFNEIAMLRTNAS